MEKPRKKTNLTTRSTTPIRADSRNSNASPVRTSLNKHRRKLTLKQSMFNLELEPSNPYTSREALQSRSITRLHRGQSAYKRPESSMLKQADESQMQFKQFEDDLSTRDQLSLTEFIDSLTMMKPLAYEMELLKEAAAGKLTHKPIDSLGLFYQLQEELKGKYADVDEVPPMMAAEMQRLTVKLREFMHNLTATGQKDQCVLLELFWRQVVKLIDFTLVTHAKLLMAKVAEVETLYHCSIGNTKRRLTLQNDSCIRENLRLMSVNAGLDERLKSLTKKLEELKLYNYELVREKLAVETNYSRSAELSSMSELLWKIDRYIADSEAGHSKQAEIIKGLGDVMQEHRNIQDNLNYEDKVAQTDWSVLETELPMRPTPLACDHVFYDLFYVKGLEEKGFIGLQALEQVLRHANTTRNFCYNLAVTLVRKHSDSTLVSSALKAVFRQVKMASSQEWVFYQLLYLERHLPIEALKYVQTLLVCMDQLGDHAYLPYSELEPMLIQLHANDSKAADDLLSCIDSADLQLPTPPADLRQILDERVEADSLPYVIFLWCRLCLTLDRKNVSWKIILNLADLSERGSVKIPHLARLLKTKLQMPVTEREVFIFCRMFRPVAGRISKDEALKATFANCPAFGVSKFGVLKAALQKWIDRLDLKTKEATPTPTEDVDDYISRIRAATPALAPEDLAYCHYLNKLKPFALPSHLLKLGIVCPEVIKLTSKQSILTPP